MSTCLIFVFASLLEFAIVHVLARRHAQEQQLQQQLQQQQSQQTSSNQASSPMGGPLSGRPSQASRQFKRDSSDVEMRLLSAAEERVTDITLREESSLIAASPLSSNVRWRTTGTSADPNQDGMGTRRPSLLNVTPMEEFQQDIGSGPMAMIDAQATEVTQLQNVPMATPCPHDPGAPYHLCQRCLTCRKRAPAFQAVDQFSRAFFPILFGLFNAAYWIFYMVILP